MIIITLPNLTLCNLNEQQQEAISNIINTTKGTIKVRDDPK